VRDSRKYGEYLGERADVPGGKAREGLDETGAS
jgi:hypothetical protein